MATATRINLEAFVLELARHAFLESLRGQYRAEGGLTELGVRQAAVRACELYRLPVSAADALLS